MNRELPPTMEPRFELAKWIATEDRIHKVKEARRHPWCRSPDAPQSADHRFPGVVAALTFTLGPSAALGGGAALWTIAPGEDDAAATPLVKEAKKLADEAVSLATCVAPFILQPQHLLADPALRARLVARCGRGADPSIDGPSVGLALVLAGVSLLLDEAMPTTFVATAEVTRGSLDLPLQPVAGIWEKMCIVADAALGIDRVLVHKDNVNQAEDALSHWAPARRVKVVGLEFASEAVTEVFGSVEEIRERLGRERRGAAPELASRLFLIARRPIVSQMKSWVGVRDAASLVAGWLPPEATREREKADLAGRIAARHAGNGEMATILIPLPPEEELLEMPRPMRLQHLAQAVQSAADSDDTNSRLYSLLAEEHVKSPMSERSIEDWQLLGAIGRALAAAGDYARAASALSEAIAGSSANHQEHETSFALSELLRVLGLAGDQGTLRQSLGRDLPALEGHAETASISIGFARCAAGRALVQAGASREALPYLADAPRVDWNKMPIHLRLARERWLARACAECGDHDGHRRAMAALDTATAAGEAPPAAVLLARIDRSLRDGDHDGAAAHLEELSAHPEEAHEIARLLGRHERRDDADREVSAARFVAEHYRY